MVPGAGLEPARSNERKILSLVCLPIPPPGLTGYCCAGLAGPVLYSGFDSSNPLRVWLLSMLLQAIPYNHSIDILLDNTTSKMEARPGIEPG